jgi:hypothetical protein
MRRLSHIVVAVLSVLAFCSSAGASTLLTDSSGRWLHQHTTVYTYRIDPSVPSWWASGVDQAAREWSDQTSLTLVKTSSTPNITIRAIYDTKAPVGRASVRYHAAATITLNLYRMTGNLIDQLLGYPQSVACHELGHTIGLGHGGSGCMGTNRQEGDAPDGIRVPTSGTNHPGIDDVMLVNQRYSQPH